MQPDPIKHVFDDIVQTITDSLSGSAKDFYDREFNFFEKVTSISGKLKPFIKRPKVEKKVSGSLFEVIIEYLPHSRKK